MFHPDKTSAATSALSDFDDDDHQKNIYGEIAALCFL